MPYSRMSRKEVSKSFPSLRYLRLGFEAALTKGYRRITRAISPVAISPASNPQHSFGNAARAWANISLTNWVGRRRRNGVDNGAKPPEDDRSPLAKLAVEPRLRELCI